MIRTYLLAGLLSLGISGSGGAQESERPPSGIIIGSDKPQAPAYERSCVEVEIGGEKAPALNCLNRKLRGQVDKTQIPALAAPFDANSQDTHLGIANPSAVRQQYGTNYGVSAAPQRPTR
jgi:hypothetical protein